MTRRLLVVLVSLISFHQAFAQDKKIEESYARYFQNTREIPYLHLNKTSFLKGEEIWFQAYVLEQNTNKLHPTTSNLYVSIFDTEGTLKEQKLVRIDKGLGKGSILIDSTYTGERYFIKVSTNWMKNVKEDQSYVQKIKIIGAKKNTTTNLEEKDFFDFQVFPEGGHLLEGIPNNVGVLIKNKNGKGQQPKEIKLTNSTGETISTFGTNFLGMGNVSFTYQENESYEVTATLENGTVLTQKLPTAEKTGVSLMVDNPGTPFVKISLFTNKNTLANLVGKRYKVWIHNTSSYYNNHIEFQENNLAYTLLIKKNKFSKGINIITIFNENQEPVLERLIFNYSDDLFTAVDANIVTQNSDSISTKITNQGDEKLHLSASFLPSDTKSYHPTNSIISAFLLKPYIKGTIENPEYYFKNSNRNKLRDLDLLLLTQGWSKYNWNAIFNSTPTVNFPFENGITLTGTVNAKIKKNESLLLFSDENNLVRQIEPENNKFTLENLFITKGSKLRFGINNRERLYETQPVIQNSKGSLFERIPESLLHSNEPKELLVSNFGNLTSGRELLDEVTLVSRKRNDANKPYGKVTMLTGYKIDNMILGSGETVIDFLRSKRYQVNNEFNGDIRIVPRGNRARTIMEIDPNTWNSAPADLPIQPAQFGGQNGVRVFLDDNDISQSLWMLVNLYLTQIDEIYFGRGTDVWNAEQIYIYSATPKAITERTSSMGNVIVKQGFAKEKEYYEPVYPSFLNETYTNFGALYWKPNLELNSDGTQTILLPKNYQKNVTLFIEGITESGKLTSQRIELK